MTAETPSLAGRAALAVLLMVGFYLLALSISVGLMAIPVAEYFAIHRVHFKLALVCVGGALVILWSVLPRWDRFPPPGVPLREDEQPELFAVIRDVARAAGQAMPREVYLVPEVNAFVAQRGGLMGFFSRRVLGLGLPLLRTLDADQMRAVLAHEFGHFHGGDTKLGPWIYKTRSAIGRTLQALEGRGSALRHPFRWYGNLFLRITHAISRAQEYAADRLAARLVGAAPLREGLMRLPALATLYDVYLQRELGPVLSAGRRPPYAEGYRLFLEHPEMVRAAEQITAEAAKQTEPDPFDTHPPTPLRVQALAALERSETAASDRRPAWSWLRQAEALDEQVLAFLAGRERVAKLPRVAWSEVAEALWVPSWKAQFERWCALQPNPLADLRLGALPAAVAEARTLGARCASALESEVPEEQHEDFGRYVLSAALGLALHGAGFEASSPPGAPVTLRRGEHAFTPIEVVRELAAGTLDEASWRARCEAAGVLELALA
ncbi:MAG: M48 family metallopeptidase [Planctomycetes bacterium]|nr:M48 family metallopeptidase [Planctomycetota bacterium]